jgi:hypothetical protein
VKRHFVDAEMLFEVGEEPDQGLSDRPGADDVNDILHGVLLTRANILQGIPL